MKAAIRETEQGYEILLPDHTVKPAEDDLVRSFFLRFDELEDNIMFQNGEGTWEDAAVDFNRVVAYVDDSNEMHITNAKLFRSFLGAVDVGTKYISDKEYAKKYNITVERVKSFLQIGEVEGAKRVGGKYGFWIIPEDAPYPVNVRFSAGGTQDRDTKG